MDTAQGELIGELGAWPTERAPDNSQLCERYLQICSNVKSGSYLRNGQPIYEQYLINPSEYMSRIANSTQAHVLHLEWLSKQDKLTYYETKRDEDPIWFEIKAQELLLWERQGRDSMYFKAVADWKELSGKLDRYFKKLRDEQSFNVCQVPQFLKKAGSPV